MPIDKIQGLPNIYEIKQEIESDNLNQKQPQATPGKHNKKHLVALSLSIILVSLIYISLKVNTSSPAGTGSISGIVTNEKNTPIPADVMLAGSSLTTSADANGNFKLTGLPAGEAEIFITYQGQGVDKMLKLDEGQEISLGTIQVQSTLVAGE